MQHYVQFHCGNCGAIQRVQVKEADLEDAHCTCTTCGRSMSYTVGSYDVPPDLAEDQAEVDAFKD